ncbi:MAG: hypothetical protein KA184_06035 [Candidatus Hydrogenedentes bacterium]|nr:hypothetical protein [Candidatus Hydrogenedentota bacterium]
MRCAYHILREAVGYCCVCGEFGCADCLTEHEKKYYCQKHYKPIADEKAQQKRRTDLKRRVHRQRLVARMQSGEVYRGFCYHLNTEEPGFYLDLVDDADELTGERRMIPFAEMKALFYVKSFDGKFDRNQDYSEWSPQGAEVVVQFRDGETMQGFALNPYQEGQARFYVIPGDPNSNEISVLVEASAAVGVYTPEEFKNRQKAEMAAFVREHAQEGLSQDELIGDYYFTRHAYHRASHCYRAVLERMPGEARVIRKVASAEYNIGVRHVREHEYSHALRCMETVIRLVPEDDKVAQKARQIRERIRSVKHSK